MPASPARIAKSTVDGVVVERVSAPLKQTHPNATDIEEIESFFDSAAHAEIRLQERWAWQSDPARLREAVELDASLGLASDIDLAPTLPRYTVIDESRGIEGPAVVKAIAFNYDEDRYGVELIGMGEIDAVEPLTLVGDPDLTAVEGEPYYFAPIADGGLEPYRFSIGPAVPAGLTFNRATGVLSGSPTGGLPGALNIDGVPAIAQEGVAYSFIPEVEGGVPIYEFTLNGDLPPGMVFDTSTGEISGTPT